MSEQVPRGGYGSSVGLSPKCGACAGERRKFDSIGVGVTDAPRPWPFQATDVRGVRGGAPQFQLDRRG